MNLTSKNSFQLVTIFVLFLGTVRAKDEEFVLCYHDIDTVGKKDRTRFNLENFNATLCTHTAYNVIRVDPNDNKVINPNGKNGQLQDYLKTNYPQHKILVILNLDQFFTEISHNEVDKAAHEDMAENVVAFLEIDMYDGVYLEMMPSFEKRSSFMNIIKSLNKAFSPKKLILAYASNSNEDTIYQGYDISELGQNVDMLILETCNFHDATTEPKWADHPAPLYNRPWDKENKTVDFLVNHYIENGFPAKKILLSISPSGKSWTISTNRTNPPAPANGKGAPGRLTSRRGILSYYEICENVRNKNWTVFPSDGKTMGPYAVSPSDTSPNQIWVGYDDPAMAVIKSKYILSKGLGGASIHEISYDDIDDRCGGGKYPIITAIHETLSSPQSTEQLADYTVTFWICGLVLSFGMLLSAVVAHVVRKRKLAKRRESVQQAGEVKI